RFAGWGIRCVLKGRRREHESVFPSEPAARSGRAWRIAALVGPAAHRLVLFARAFAATPARPLDRASRGATAGECFGRSATDRKSYWHDPVDARIFGRRAPCAGSVLVRAGASHAECDRRTVLDRGGARCPAALGWDMY